MSTLKKKKSIPSPKPRSSSKSKKTHSYHHENLRGELLEAALDILKHRGLDALALRAIARKVGVSHTAPYRHFEDKEAIIVAIAEEGLIELNRRYDECRKAHANNLREQLLEFNQSYVRFALEGPERFKVMFKMFVGSEAICHHSDEEAKKKHPKLMQLAESTLKRQIDFMAQCQQHGLLKKGNPALFALSMWSLIHGFSMLSATGMLPLVGLEVSSPEELARRLSELVLSGIQTKM